MTRVFAVGDVKHVYRASPFETTGNGTEDVGTPGQLEHRPDIPCGMCSSLHASETVFVVDSIANGSWETS
jgi:hypothetical protein